MQINKFILVIAGIAGVAFAMPDTEITVKPLPGRPNPSKGDCPSGQHRLQSFLITRLEPRLM
ncbi:hypothetical protein PspLS_07566 [Pyricularia sp. CBS 133598]|nr:hypothetical protein PspLS_07566 [Pyricularia sp. CBS 133598]